MNVIENIIDVLESFPDAVLAERKGCNSLILRKLDNPIKRADGKRATYELEHRWHKSIESDINSVQGQEFTFWQRKELKLNKKLFEQVDLF